MLHTHLYIFVALTRRTTAKSANLPKSSALSEIWEHWVEKYLIVFSLYRVKHLCLSLPAVLMHFSKPITKGVTVASEMRTISRHVCGISTADKGSLCRELEGKSKKLPAAQAVC
jgi:hypothetical protein